MDFLGKIRDIEIDTRYDINVIQMREIKEGSQDLCDAISCAFSYGYMQGQKAEQTHRKSIKVPVHKNDYRRAIAGNADKIKNVVHLKTLYRLTEELTSDERMEQNGFYTWSITNHLTNGDLTDREIMSVHYFIGGIMSRKGGVIKNG